MTDIFDSSRRISPQAQSGLIGRNLAGFIPGPSSKRAVVEAFKANFPRQVSKKLIEHYAFGHGRPYPMPVEEMVECNALIDFGNSQRSVWLLQHIELLGKEIATSATSPASRKRIIETSVCFDMLGLCNTSGTLGDFTVTASGLLKVWDPNSDGSDADWSFDGHMWFYDLWDFDRRGASASGQAGRTSKGSFRTNVGAALLPGTPFVIKSVEVPVSQARAEAKGSAHYAKWQGNPKGELLPVVAGLL